MKKLNSRPKLTRLTGSVERNTDNSFWFSTELHDWQRSKYRESSKRAKERSDERKRMGL